MQQMNHTSFDPHTTALHVLFFHDWHPLLKTLQSEGREELAQGAKIERKSSISNTLGEYLVIAECLFDEVADLFNTNVLGAMRVCQAALPHFRSKNIGLIINMSSMGGLLAVPYMGAYTSSKFALEAMTV